MRPQDIRRPDTPPEEDEALSLALQRLAPVVNESGVWPSLQPRVGRARRRRNVTRAVGAIAVIVMVGLATWQGLRLADADRTADMTVVTHPGAPDGGTGPAVTLPSASGAVLLPTDTTDPRVDVVRRWVAALAAGDIGTAWGLLDPQAQKVLGSVDALHGMSSDLGRSWASGSDVRYQVIDGKPFTGRPIAVVTLFGRTNLAGQFYARATPFLVVSGEGGGPRVTPIGLQQPPPVSTPHEWLRLTSPDGNGAVLAPYDALTFMVPTETLEFSPATAAGGSESIRTVPGPIVMAVDGVLVVKPGQWETSGKWEKSGDHDVFTGIYNPPALGHGEHVVTVVQFRDNGMVSTDSALFTVADRPATITTALPRSRAGVTSDHTDVETRSATDELNAYLRAVRDGDAAAFAATLSPTDQAAAAQLFADERSLLARVGEQAYYLKSVRYNWWQDEGWFLGWSPEPPPEVTLSVLAHWVQARWPVGMVALVTVMDGTTRSCAFEVTADGISLRALGSVDGDLKLLDILGQTAHQVMRAYLEAKKTGDEQAAYALLGNPELPLEAYLKEMSAAGETLLSYDVGEWKLSGDNLALVTVSFKTQFASDGHIVEGAGESWRCERVDGLWKIGWPPRL